MLKSIRTHINSRHSKRSSKLTKNKVFRKDKTKSYDMRLHHNYTSAHSYFFLAHANIWTESGIRNSRACERMARNTIRFWRCFVWLVLIFDRKFFGCTPPHRAMRNSYVLCFGRLILHLLDCWRLVIILLSVCGDGMQNTLWRDVLCQVQNKNKITFDVNKEMIMPTSAHKCELDNLPSRMSSPY